jgi:formate dehydrogenase major subunit
LQPISLAITGTEASYSTSLTQPMLDFGRFHYYTHPQQIMEEIARLPPPFAALTYEKLDRLGSVQWPCTAEAPEGTPTMHVHQFVRGKGKFWPTEYIPTSERSTSRFPLILTTGRVLTQYNVGAQTRRTNNVVWHAEDVLEIHPHDAEVRGIVDGDWVGLTSRAGDTVLRAKVSRRDRPGGRLHHLPLPGDQRQRRHHREF